MQELIAKRYIKAVRASTDMEGFENISTIMSVIAAAFNTDKFKQILLNPTVGVLEKKKLLLGTVEGIGGNEIKNLLSLLAENGRIDIIPALACEMKKTLAREKNSFSGKVYSDSEIDSKTVENLAFGIHKKTGSIITLEYVQNDYDGVKVEVEDLGIEINFSKNRLNMQLIEHILKAI